ncbi:MAG: alanine--tRNA ligase [Nanoarchaeota archaeon]|nr:alanine--tRNA ligase [Nanoarchaeota archaeon]
MKAKELRDAYLHFFETKGHAVIPSASLIPINDPSVLFNTAGMQPLVPYLSGQKHPQGKRLVNNQKCLRTVDFDEVGDNTHHTFFQMLGNWSLGDYFKKEAIEWSYEFLTKVLKIPVNMLAVTCFKGNKDLVKDEEAYDIWRNLGIPKNRIAFLEKDNFWIAGEIGPCGPSSEMFYWTGNSKAPEKYDPQDERWVEIWNDVFMAFNKTKDGIKPLDKKNVDTGMGFERTLAVLNGKKSAYETDLFQPIIKRIEELSKKSYEKEQKAMRIIADHIRASVFILGDDNAVTPSNLDRGYILRRLIRRAIRYGKMISIEDSFLPLLADEVIKEYKPMYPELKKNEKFIFTELQQEEEKFEKTIEKGLREFDKMSKQKNISGKGAFLLFQSYGFPLEMTEELADEKKITVDVEGFFKEYEEHKKLSKKGAEKKFKGGLADLSEDTIKMHTATHLLNEVLRRVISKDIKQRGSNITSERLRFDFSFDRKLTEQEVAQVEEEMMRIIHEAIPVIRKEMSKTEAIKIGAEMEFGQKYPDIVSVYLIGDYSKEFCGGPHVKNTKDIGYFKIVKQKSVAAGVRRIRAVVREEPSELN